MAKKNKSISTGVCNYINKKIVCSVNWEYTWTLKDVYRLLFIALSGQFSYLFLYVCRFDVRIYCLFYR